MNQESVLRATMPDKCFILLHTHIILLVYWSLSKVDDTLSPFTQPKKDISKTNIVQKTSFMSNHCYPMAPWFNIRSGVCKEFLPLPHQSHSLSLV